jgi:hypothetical protein
MRLDQGMGITAALAFLKTLSKVVSHVFAAVLSGHGAVQVTRLLHDRQFVGQDGPANAGSAMTEHYYDTNGIGNWNTRMPPLQ